MERLTKRRLQLDTVEAYACICLYGVCSCMCAVCYCYGTGKYVKELDKNMQYNGVTGEASNSVSYNNGLAQNLQA